ncbi:hypothetical protein BACEGG_00653 [Bacteroides eggerthii DSM 20697]|nr:hypothetical protein BACEGG_00653 [Bacteroides eggerthii DSM 20697]
MRNGIVLTIQNQNKGVRQHRKRLPTFSLSGKRVDNLSYRVVLPSNE